MKGGTAGMSATRYRRGRSCSADMAAYLRTMSEASTNAAELSLLRRNLGRAMREEITERQRTALTLYYVEGMNMEQVGARMGVTKSTVSRTIKRGEARLRRCLRYGAARLLRPED